MSVITRLAAAALFVLTVAAGAAQAADRSVNLDLATGRSNYDNGYRPATAVRSGDVVTVSGLVRNGSVGELATLPSDMRPAQQLIFNVNVHDGTARIDVYPNGNIRMSAGSTKAGWISLDGVSFPVGRAKGLKLENGWRNYGNRFAGAGAQLEGETVFVTGLVVPGRDRVIAKLPPGMRPSKALIFNLNGSHETARVDVYPDGSVIAVHRAPTAKWISLSGITFNRRTGTALRLAGGWRHYGEQYAPATVTKIGNRVTVSGVVRAASSRWGHIATLPPGTCPESRLIFNLNNNERTSRVDVIGDCRIMWNAGGHDHGWLSLDGIAFDLGSPAAPIAGSRSHDTAERHAMLDRAYALIKGLHVPEIPGMWNQLKDRFDFEKDGKLAKVDITLFNQKATVVIYRPKSRTAPNDPVNVAVLIDNVKISNLISQVADTVADDLQVNKASYIFVPRGNEEYIDTADLPQPVRGFVEQVRTGPIDILAGHNMFAQVDTRDNGTTAKFLRQVNVPLDHLKVNASYGFRKSRETNKSDPYQAVRLTRDRTWNRAFYLDGVAMVNPTFEYAKHGNVTVFRSWGTARIRQKDYFMFAQKTGASGAFPTAVALDTASITLKDYVQLSMLFSNTLFSGIPAFQDLAGKTGHLSSVLDKVEIWNPRYNRGKSVDKDNNPVFKNMLLMAASKVDELPDGNRTKGAAMIAHGTGKVFGLNAASIDAEIYKSPNKAKELDVTARVTLPSKKALRLGGFDFRLFKNGNAFVARLNGKAKLAWDKKTIFNKSVSFDVSNSGLRFSFPATCPVQLWDWTVQAGFDLRSANSFKINPALGCDPLDLLGDMLAHGQKIVELGTGVGKIVTQQISKDTWRGLQNFGGGMINPDTLKNAVTQYGNPAAAASKLAEKGKDIARGVGDTILGWFSGGSSSSPEPIFMDDPAKCQSGQAWSIQFGTCWTPGAEIIRLAHKPELCLSIRHRYRERGKAIELWNCVGDWHQQWRRSINYGIRDGLKDAYCWEQDADENSLMSMPCESKYFAQQFYRDSKNRLQIKIVKKKGSRVGEINFKKGNKFGIGGPDKYDANESGTAEVRCLTAKRAWADGDILLMPCQDGNPLQKWVFMSRKAFK